MTHNDSRMPHGAEERWAGTGLGHVSSCRRDPAGLVCGIIHTSQSELCTSINVSHLCPFFTSSHPILPRSYG